MTASIILGTGSYTPDKIITNDDMSKIVDTSDEWIATRTGIRQRRFAADDETTSDMAIQAANKAILSAGIEKNSIDCIIFATMTPDMPFPSSACLLQDKMGLPNVTAFDIQAACSGFIYALNLANTMILSKQYKTILIIGAEKLSSILDFKDRTTCVLFGDGASAAIVSKSDDSGVGILHTDTGADGGTPELLHQPAGGSAIPPCIDSINNRLHFLKMNGKEIFKKAVRVMGQSCVKSLEACNLTAADIDLVIPHQANMRIIESLAKRLEIPLDKFHNNLDLYGNTSAASIGIALDEAIKANRIKKGDRILLVAFGAGLTWGSQIIQW
ncbi:MAG: beta-ketoacyl-ACP synthase III [Coraliomargaritaceae bacterium]